MEGSVVAYYGELVEEIIAAEQGGLTEGEKALLELLNKKLCREMRKAAYRPEPKTGGRTMNKTQLALKILKNRRARQIAVRALKNKRVRGVVAKQVSRRLLGE